MDITSTGPRDQRRFQVLGVPVDACRDVTAAAIGVRADGGGQIVTLNAEMTMAARSNHRLGAVIADADLVVPDGAGVVWALSSISDSTLTAANRDTITFGSTGTSVIYRARFDEFNLSLGTFRTGDQSATNGVVTFTAGTDGSVTSRAEIINGSMTDQGTIAGFSDSSNRAFLFIQGGSSYSIVQLGNGANTSVSALAVAGGKDITITMGA